MTTLDAVALVEKKHLDLSGFTFSDLQSIDHELGRFFGLEAY